MTKDLVAFLKKENLDFKRGFVFFEKNYYVFENDGAFFNAEVIDEKLFKTLFRIYAEKRMDFFVETLKGVSHNVKGQISPAFARFDFVEMELEELEEEFEIDKLRKYYDKIKSSVLGLKTIMDNITEYVGTGSFVEKSFVFLNPFFEGFYHGLITDLDIKHKFIFEKGSIVKEDKVNCVPALFQKVMFFYFMSLASLFPYSEKVKVEVSVEKNDGGSVLRVESGISPVVFDENNNLLPYEVESFGFLNLCKEVCEKSGIGFDLSGNIAEFVFGG